MMNCKQAAELICKALDQPLTLRQRVALRFHLLMCSYCRGFEQQNQALLELFEQRFQHGDAAQEEGLSIPAEACDRLKTRLRAAVRQPDK